MKNLKAKALLPLIVILFTMGFSSCSGNLDSFYCRNVEIELVNTTRMPIYYSFSSNYCNELLRPGETHIVQFGNMEIDYHYPPIVNLDYKYYSPGISREESVVIEITDCWNTVYLE